jgi:hypothetical protein
MVPLVLAAIVAHLALVDAAIETLWFDSPLHPWVTVPTLAFVGLSLWAWRPGGPLLRRFGPGGAAATAAGGLLALFAATAWLPGGQTSGVRMLLQSTATLLTVVTAAAVVLATTVIVQALTLVPARARHIARALVVMVGLYALLALALAVFEHASFAGLLQGGGAWQRLPRWLQGPFLGAFVLLPLAVFAQLVQILVHLRDRRSVRLLVQQATVLLVACSATLPGVRTPPGMPLGMEGEARMPGTVVPAQALDQSFRLLEGLSRELTRGTFDPQAIVDSQGRAPARLFEWVRDETLWVPYTGELRGPVGVLMDRVGNSVDRSLLLAELLRLAGHTVRLAHASLSEQQAGELLSRVRAAPTGGLVMPKDGLSAEALERLKRTARESGLSADASEPVRRQTRQVLAEATDRLSKVTPALLDAAGKLAAVDAVSARASAARSIQDHWWVQVRIGAGWVDADTLPAHARMGEACARATETVDRDPAAGGFRLDARMVHRATIRVVVEQLKQGRLAERVVLAHEFRPCDRVGEAIVFRHVPLDWPKGLDASNEADLKKAVLAQTQWLPALFIGTKVVFQSAFTMSGDVMPRPEWNPATQTAAAAAGKLGGLGGMLGGGEEPEPEALLTAEWLDYELSGPGEEPRTFRRAVFDLLGPAARAAGAQSPPGGDAWQLDRGLALLGSTRILAMPSSVSPYFLLHMAVRQYLNAKDKILEIAQTQDRNRRTELAREALDPPSGVGLLHSWAVGRQRLSPVRGEVYLDSLNVVTHRTELSHGADGKLVNRERMDIVANPVAVLGTSRENPVSVRIRQGLADTETEGVILLEPGHGEATTTMTLFVLAAAKPLPLSVLTPGRQPDWGQIDLSADVRARIEQDLAAGYLTVLPPRPVLLGGSPRFGWFRVHPTTGETLGVMDDGLHEGMSENSILRMKTWYAAVRAGTISWYSSAYVIAIWLGFDMITMAPEEQAALLRAIEAMQRLMTGLQGIG